MLSKPVYAIPLLDARYMTLNKTDDSPCLELTSTCKVKHSLILHNNFKGTVVNAPKKFLKIAEFCEGIYLGSPLNFKNPTTLSDLSISRYTYLFDGQTNTGPHGQEL